MLTPVMQEALRRENQLEPIWRDLYEFRLLIEPQAAVWMATRGSDRDLAQLASLASERRAFAEDVAKTGHLLAADQAFHKLIARGAANRVLAGFIRAFGRRYPFYGCNRD